MKKGFYPLFLIAGSLAFTASALHAQVDRTALNGSVRDASGAAIAHATVRITQPSTGFIRETVTGASGTYSIGSLPRGAYHVTIFQSGFQNAEFDDVQQIAGDTRTLDAVLQVSGVQEAVEVQYAPPQLDKSSAELGGTIAPIQLEKVPLNGRNWATLENLAPGAIDAGTGTEDQIRFAGQGSDDNNFRLDGIDTSGIQHASLKSGLRLQFSTESIAEFKVDTSNYSADNGGSAGAQVNIVTKSGTNNIHGSVFEFLRNSAVDALSPFATPPNPTFHLNQFGGSVGGPIFKDRTFFFADYEGFRQQLSGIPQIGLVPSASLRAQIAAAQPALAAFISAYPAGNQATADPNVDALTASVPTPDVENSGMIRIDHRFNAANSIFARYNIDDGKLSGAVDQVGQSGTTISRPQNLILDYLHVFSPTLLNDFKFGVNRTTYTQFQTTGVPYNLNVGGLNGLVENYSVNQANTVFDFVDNATFVRNKHTLKVGVEVRRVGINESNSVDGSLNYTSIADLLANRLNSISLTAALPTKGLRKTQYFAFAQDEWKPTRNLTFNLGVRYSLFNPFHEAQNRAYPFDIATCGGYCARGAEFTFPNYNDFDPRLSLAWAPDQYHGTTVFRIGYSINRGEIQLGDEDSPVVNDEPSTTLNSGIQSNGATVQYAYPVAPGLLPSTGLALTPRSLARHHPDSYVQNWTTSVQQQFGPATVVTFSYIGAKGTDLFRRTYTNLIDPITGTRPLPQYPSAIDTKQNHGSSIFHALQINVTHQLHRGLFFGANYMWSHAIDDSSVGAGEANSAENVNNFRAERGPSNFDARNSGNISGVYQLPFGRGRAMLTTSRVADVFAGGWEMSNLFSARSAFPIDITIPRNSNDLPDGNSNYERPDLVLGQPLYLPNHNPHAWINPAAFTMPLPGTWGNTPRNYARGLPVWQDDVALDKDFSFTERYRLNFRAEAFNVLNRAQYGDPVGDTSSGNFGTSTTTVNQGALVGPGTPRELQFSLRFSY